MNPIFQDAPKINEPRWRFFRDVLVFQLKIFIGNLRDFALMPVSVAAAVLDLVNKGDREGSRFTGYCTGARVANKYSTPTAQSGRSWRI